MSLFPNSFNTNLELPMVDDNLTEIGGDVINSLRDAVFVIERVIGRNPHGNKASLADRINVSIDANGNIKSSAISSLGLVTLPIVNSHVGSNAAILESKLDLDFSTQSLKNSINSIITDIGGLQDGVNSISSSLNIHILGAGNFHDGYDVLINAETDPQLGIGGLSATTIGDALNEIAGILFGPAAHIDLTLPAAVKHQATGISVDASNFEVIDSTSENVQEALDSIDAKQGAFGARHLDTFHSNGILKEISSGEAFNANQKLLGPVTGLAYAEGESVVTVPDVVSFSALGVEAGDLLDISSDELDLGTYQIRAVGPLISTETLGGLPVLAANQLAVFHTFVETKVLGDEVIASIYEPSTASSQNAPLACAIRNNETIVDSVSVLNPNAARVVSLGFNGAIINGDGYSIGIQVGFGNGVYRSIEVPDLNLERLNVNQAQPVDAKSVAERINAYVSDPSLGFHFPVSAFRIGNELAVSHNLVGLDYTIEILDGYSANYALGFDELGANVLDKVVIGNNNNSFTVNGVELSTLRTVFEGQVSISSDSTTFVLLDSNGNPINPLDYGIRAGSVMHVTDHPIRSYNGSYTLLSANSTTVSTFATESIALLTSPTVFSVTFSDAQIPLTILDNLESSYGVVEVLVNSSGATLMHQRLVYDSSLGSPVEIIDVSSTFPVGEFTLAVTVSGDLATFTIQADSLVGVEVVINKNFKGTFKVYHQNNLDYFTVKTAAGTLITGSTNVTVSAPLPQDEAMLLATLHFNGTLTATNIIDNRIFGNISAGQVGDDFIELFSQRPVRELRSDGVVRGFDVLDLPLSDLITGIPALPLSGGTAYINGVRVEVETQKVLVQSYDDVGALISGVRIIGINEFGSLQAFSDELGELLVDGYNSDSTFGKILPLYKVTFAAGGITEYIDLRLFINDLDSKLELIVDQTNNVVGNFRSLEGALLYAASYPNREHLAIKVINSISTSGQIVVPNGVSILGTAPWGGVGRHQIVNSSSLADSFVVLEGNNRLENIEILSEVITLNGALLELTGSNIVVNKCLLQFSSNVGSVDSDVGILVNSSDNVSITNNRINQIYSAIISEAGCNNLVIKDNVVTNLNGTGGVAHGIKVGSSVRAVDAIFIEHNSINVPSVVVDADIRGISVDVGETIGIIRIENNDTLHTAGNTMTNGIRIENESATGNKVTNLFINNNTVDGIVLDDNNVWGVYVDDVENANVNYNIIANIGVDLRTSVGCIEIAADVDFANVEGNQLLNSNTTRGIEVLSGDQVKIVGNTLDNLGTSSWYISGNGTRSTVTDNILVGPGERGIRWTGTNSTISNNNLSQPGDGSQYSFSDYGLYLQTSDLDVMQNTITGMIYDDNATTKPIGITNVDTSRNRIKFVGNTVSGSFIYKLIEVFGGGHNISSNKLFNSTIIDSNDTIFINLNSADNVLIMGNSLLGDGYAGIYAASTITDVSIVNNIVDPSQGTSGIINYAFNFGASENCFVVGNKLPVNGTGVSSDSVIGITSSYSVYNSNIIGINAGLKDTRNLSAQAATTAFELTSDGYYNPHWILNETNAYYEVINIDAASRKLYFSLDNMPNGVRLLTAQAYGSYNTQGTLTIQAYKQNRNNMTQTAISAADTITTNGDFGTIGDSDGQITMTQTNGEIINYSQSSYYIVLTHSGSTENPEGINIHGLVLTFRY